MKLRREHGNTVMLCAKFQNDSTAEICVMDRQDFVRVAFMISFDHICPKLQWACFTMIIQGMFQFYSVSSWIMVSLHFYCDHNDFL